MNIEEAIDVLTQKEVIDLSNHFNNTRFFEAIYIVLTAYEKEKEKNKKYLVNLTHEQYIELVEQITSEINEEWKDKIKAMLENEIINISGFECVAKGDVQSLLEKE